MNINIRQSIIDNFRDEDIKELESSINDALNDREEITLPGLGVLFELAWLDADEKLKNNILNSIYQSIKKSNNIL